MVTGATLTGGGLSRPTFISSALTGAVGMALVVLVTSVLVIRVRKRGLEALSGRAEATGPGV
ncbi:hypothetical protein GCM10010275_50000 [Streptomyces litmocidini]|uniref:hypothetical protein n=1 Tax=Streptomyces litmocidini TaxID=67318 RepID=UPI00167C8344|nr:hypothetical protein [Streptomyces litmocidini]GGV04524.1 hypothetical protein GCM10010275_50000 [Streptomyces litmocidini]